MEQEDWIVEVDEDDRVVGKIDRELAHKMDQLKRHREVMVLLFTDGSHDRFLLQHRSLKKKQLPGYWTLSVTGHVDYPDITANDPTGYLTAAARETKEEIGVEVENLKLMGQIEQKIPVNWAMMGVVTGEYRGELTIDPEEVSEIGIFDKDTVGNLDDKLTPGAKKCLEYLGIIKN